MNLSGHKEKVQAERNLQIILLNFTLKLCAMDSFLIQQQEEVPEFRVTSVVLYHFINSSHLKLWTWSTLVSLKCASNVSNSLLITESGGCNFDNQFSQIIIAEFQRPTSLGVRFLSLFTALHFRFFSDCGVFSMFASVQRSLGT